MGIINPLRPYAYHPDHSSPACVRPICATISPRRIAGGRKNEVLRLLVQDLSNLQKAGQLVVSRRTVDAHLRSIYYKLGVKFRDAAIRVAKEQAIEMAQLALTLDATMNRPVDIECAFAGGKLYLLQCRPITTLQ